MAALMKKVEGGEIESAIEIAGVLGLGEYLNAKIAS